MARRSLWTFLMALVVSVMVGLREATGIGPPPPTLSTEEIHWLSPELDNDPGMDIVISDDAPLPDADALVERVAAPPRGVLRSAHRLLRSFFRRGR